MANCIFCKIAQGEIPAELVWSNEHVIAFRDLHPQAPTHVLIVPRYHAEDILALAKADEGDKIAAELLKAVPAVAKALGVDATGFRLINNCGEGAGQSVMHLHFHLLAGPGMGEKIV